ncbi:unnamed protein product [Orchesella dallaii]|uniref:Uncharacterized protein n=1 Tax=Orchesella dallaii TaxID=48710 RepID=A0ABP1R5B4_9HEXA
MSVWNWEFTACELLMIDRRLVSGQTMFVDNSGMTSNVGNMVNYVWILQSAQTLQNTARMQKYQSGTSELEKTLVNLSDETIKLEKYTFRDVLRAISGRNWEFTACELLMIDRRLASGVR